MEVEESLLASSAFHPPGKEAALRLYQVTKESLEEVEPVTSAGRKALCGYSIPLFDGPPVIVHIMWSFF